MLNESSKSLSRRQFLAGGAALGLGAMGAGGLLSSCGTSAMTGAGARAGGTEINIPIHTGPWLPSYERMARLYEQETGNGVRLLPLPLEQLYSKQMVDADTRSGDYDIYTVNQPAEFWDGGFATPLEEIEPGFQWPEGVLEYEGVCKWDAGKRYFSDDGVTFGLPVVGLIELEFYRGDLYERLDLEGPPETWDDAVEASKKAKKKLGSDVHGYLIRGERNGSSWNYLSLLRSFGADIFADPPRDWTVTIDSDEALAATEKWLELASYGPPGTGSVTQSSIIALMQSGKALQTHITAAAILPFDDPTQSSLPGKIDTAVVPRSKGGDHAPTSGVWTNAIPSHIPEERKRAAYDFLSFFMRERTQMEYARASGMATNQRVYDSELVENERGQRALRAISESTPYIRRTTDYVFGSEAALAIDLRLNEIASGTRKPRDGHRLMAEELERMVEESGAAS